MALRDELLNPIAGASPGGVDLRYDPLFDKIKEARRADDDAPQGEWTTTLKTADWAMVIKLGKEALSTKSKDLQIAAWLTEALVRREGFGGLASGLDLLGGLVEQFWDNLYPEIDDGDAEMRAAPLEWVGLKLEVPVRMVALDRAGHDSFQLRDSRLVPTELMAAEDESKGAARAAAVAAGKLLPEEADNAFTATPKPWFKTLVADISGSLTALEKLNDVSQEKFGNVAPTFGKLKDALQDVQRTAVQLLKRKLEIEPDPIDAVPDASLTAADGDSASSGAPTGGSLAAEPVSRADATFRIVGAARFLRIHDPYNPAAYLLLRGFRWGELRASSDALDPKLLEAPPTNVRTSLKGLLLDARWPELLEAAETVMGSPQGRGWIDLQRYVLTAVDALGSSYFPVAAAMRGALRSLLTDLPQLLDMTLMDDTPTANAETRAWLRNGDLLPSEASATSYGNAGASSSNGDSPGHDPLSLALAEVRSGHADRAIALLMREAGREKTSRGRFLLQAQLARIMVEAGHDQVAVPVLEQLLAAIESHRLEEWESGELVAAPMALMYRVLEKSGADSGAQQSLYLRICRLDPIQAISFTQT
ncbi:MAG TPA: type VI secretion system protein TssA [Gemmatimonadaceae bacterium]|nr:type VI secretion system protein TssA [Gemmatimonadaceae bacterium]